jgi:hypothetical protein
MEVYGAKGSVLSDRQGSKYRLPGASSEQYEKSPPLMAPYDDPFRYLAATVRGKIKMQPSDLSALDNNVIVVEILEAAKKSAETGMRVEMKSSAK